MEEKERCSMMIKMASTREAREEVAPSSEKGGSVPRHVIGPASHKAESKCFGPVCIKSESNHESS